MESEGSLLCSQQTITDPYHGPDASSSRLYHIMKTYTLLN